jgi:pimeloyl-ACP methyl ester carboxylesterase
MHTFEGSEATIAYDRFGDGPDLVWIAGGGDVGSRWHPYQIPYFEAAGFRSTTFDNRGIGRTVCDRPLPWPIESFARDTIELIRGTCEPPVSLVGLSMGALIAQQVAIDAPDLVGSAVVMGTGANSTGWCWDYQEAEIEFRRAGGRLDAMMGVTHYAAMLYPARVLGDPVLWPRIRAEFEAWMDSGENETSLIPQWDMCLRFDQTAQLPTCPVPIHVIAGEQDVQAPPQDAKVVADLAPEGHYHLFEEMGHCSIYGHLHETLNPFIEGLLRAHL